MTKRVKLKDKSFEVSYSNKEIRAAVTSIANSIREDMSGKNPLFIVVLNGAFMFASDLMQELDMDDAEVSFVKLSSYTKDKSSGKVKTLIGLNEDIKDRAVVIVEDIVDTGITMCGIIEQIEALGAAEIKVASFISKPEARVKEVNIDYCGLVIPNKFIIGYGLDYDERGRNYRDIYTVVEE